MRRGVPCGSGGPAARGAGCSTAAAPVRCRLQRGGARRRRAARYTVCARCEARAAVSRHARAGWGRMGAGPAGPRAGGPGRRGRRGGGVWRAGGARAVRGRRRALARAGPPGGLAPPGPCRASCHPSHIVRVMLSSGPCCRRWSKPLRRDGVRARARLPRVAAREPDSAASARRAGRAEARGCGSARESEARRAAPARAAPRRPSRAAPSESNCPPSESCRPSHAVLSHTVEFGRA
jgi:hypothetical protein